ncbi:hypothetical protein ACQKNG_07665 [Bacillus cereus]|uniref:hypothetical protein n=1 Tax=Bacillus cereus TaxID=1396 RepID=UPI003D007296
MVISISKKLWELSFDDNSIYRAIKKILSWVEDGRHKLIFENGIDTDKIIESKEYFSYLEIIKSCVTEQFYAQGDSSDKVIRITYTSGLNTVDKEVFYNGLLLIQSNGETEYHYIDISKIDTYLGRLLYITVENMESDKEFIQAAFKAVRGRELCTESEVQFIHGGGNTIDKVTMENSEHPIRMICIIDSDRKFPEMSKEDSEKVTKLTSICEQRNLILIVLERREIENYLPLEALKSWLDKQNRSREKEHSFFTFTEEQRAFFDMKKGLKQNEFAVEEIKRLYMDYDTEEKQNLLNSGFGKTVWQAFEEVASTGSNFGECELELSNMANKIESML